MRFHHAVIATSLAALSGCESPTAPVIQSCMGSHWAVQTAIGWEPLVAPFDAGKLPERLTVTFHRDQLSPVTEVWALSRDEFIAMSGTKALGCDPNVAVYSATRLLTGSAANIPDAAYIARVTGGTVIRHGYTFDVKAPEQGEFDVIAYNTPMPVGQMILRRSVNPPAGSEMPTLDFSSAEAFRIESAPLTAQYTGGTSEITKFFTRGVQVDLRVTSGSVPQTVLGVPAARLLPGDYHVLELIRPTQIGSTFSRTFYHVPRALTASVGPDGQGGTFYTANVDGCWRGFASIPVDPNYPSFVVADFFWSSRPGRTVRLAMTKGYLAAGATHWELGIPALDPDGRCFVTSALSSPLASVGNGRFAILNGEPGVDESIGISAIRMTQAPPP